MVALIPELAVVLGGVAVGALSPLVRKIVREVFAHPGETSVITKDERTGHISARVVPEPEKAASSPGPRG